MSGNPDDTELRMLETNGARIQDDEPTNSSAPNGGTQHGFRRFLVRSLIHTGIFLVLYVLSIGPMFWVWYEAHYISGPKWIAAFYEPLRLATQIPFFRDLINDYINWWIL